jgi:hypothetical protein
VRIEALDQRLRQCIDNRRTEPRSCLQLVDVHEHVRQIEVLQTALRHREVEHGHLTVPNDDVLGREVGVNEYFYQV